MAELEIHHEGHESDSAGKRVGILAALLAVLLAVVTIASHRTHTEAIIKKSESNDEWQHYQASRMKFHNLELGERLVSTLGNGTPAARAGLDQIAAEKQRYDAQARELQERARKRSEESEAAERRALHFDLGEGMLEIALVLSSLYFIARKMFFPVIGLIGGIGGVVMAVTGLF